MRWLRRLACRLATGHGQWLPMVLAGNGLFPASGDGGPTASCRCGISESRSAGSAWSWMARWRRSGLARWPTRPSRMCSWTPSTSGSRGRPGRQPRSGDRTGVGADGGREVVGLDVGDSEGRRLAGRVPEVALGPWPSRYPAGRLRCPHRAQAGHRGGHGRAGWQRCRVQWARADSSWWLAGGRCGVVGGDEGEHLCFGAKPHVRGWELEAVFLQQG